MFTSDEHTQIVYRNTQNGFIPGLPTLSLYGAIAGIAIAAALGVALKIQGSKLATVKAELALCALQHKQALAAIEKQNQAIVELEEAALKARRSARDALERTRKAQVGVVKERDRLKALMASKQTGPCPAGEAVKKLRDGLK